MATATTEKFEELVLEHSSDGGTTWAILCGLTDVTINRTANVDTAEVPDCTDESLPFSLERAVRSIEVSVTAQGVWAQESWGTLSDWYYSSAADDIRIGNLNAATGDTEYETGTAILTNLSQNRTKGQKVQYGNIEMLFDGTPTRTAKA